METPTQTHHFDSTDVQRNFDRRLRAEREAAVAEERRRFAVELHDVVAGWLQAAVLHLTEARQSLHEDDARALELLKVIEQEVRGCWDDARRSAAALRPADLDRRGLAGALAEYVSRVSDASAVAIAFNTFGTPRPLPVDAEMTLLRVGQEAVTNAVRHADAGAIAVEVSYDTDAVRLEVTDNGHGFDPRDPGAGMGLRGMRERAVGVGAELIIHTEPDHGTQVIVTVPVDGAALPCPLPCDSMPETFLG